MLKELLAVYIGNLQDLHPSRTSQLDDSSSAPNSHHFPPAEGFSSRQHILNTCSEAVQHQLA
jgi:hypothetical protein